MSFDFFDFIVAQIKQMIEEYKEYYRKKVSKILSLTNIKRHIQNVKQKVNTIVYKAEQVNKSEMLKYIMDVMQKDNAKRPEPKKEFKEVKDFTRQGIHTTLLNVEKAKSLRQKGQILEQVRRKEQNKVKHKTNVFTR